MQRLDIDSLISMIQTGEVDKARGILNDVNRNISDKRSFGLMFEHGGTSADSPFPPENVVLDIVDKVPVPHYEHDLSYQNSSKGGGQHTPLI